MFIWIELPRRPVNNRDGKWCERRIFFAAGTAAVIRSSFVALYAPLFWPPIWLKAKTFQWPAAARSSRNSDLLPCFCRLDRSNSHPLALMLLGVYLLLVRNWGIRRLVAGSWPVSDPFLMPKRPVNYWGHSSHTTAVSREKVLIWIQIFSNRIKNKRRRYHCGLQLYLDINSRLDSLSWGRDGQSLVNPYTVFLRKKLTFTIFFLRPYPPLLLSTFNFFCPMATAAAFWPTCLISPLKKGLYWPIVWLSSRANLVVLIGQKEETIRHRCAMEPPALKCQKRVVLPFDRLSLGHDRLQLICKCSFIIPLASWTTTRPELFRYSGISFF